MKKFPIFVLLFVSSILFSSCTKTIPPEKLQIRNDVAYEVNSETPFTGLLKSTDKNNLYETEYKNGKRDGTYKEYFSDGKTKDLSHYKNGLSDGLQEHYFPNGQKQFSVNFKNGKLDGESVEFLESGQIKVKDIYSNDKIIQFNSWYSNGQKDREINFVEGKLTKLSWFYENGQNRVNFKNDKNSGANQIAFYNANGELEKNSYYLNSSILPMEHIFTLIDTIPLKDIVKSLGKPEANKNSMPELIYSDYRYYSIDPQSKDLINKALLSFLTGVDKKGKEHPMGANIVYYNRTREEDDAVNTDMHNYLIKNGFIKDPKKDNYYDKTRNITVSVILRMNNNTMYGLLKKNFQK